MARGINVWSVGWAMCAAMACCALNGCGPGESKAEEIAPPLRPISAEAVTKSKDPRFEEYRELLRKQFDALKRLGEFYSGATGGGSHPLSPADLEKHNALRGETDRLAAEAMAYVEANFPTESPDVLQQIYNEELAKAIPDQ